MTRWSEGGVMKSKIPLVSVIIPVKDGERFLKETIQSVIAQTYEEIEIIVVDNGSTDHSAKIAKSFLEVKYFFYDHKLQNAAARNFGFKKSKGEFVCFLDHDDLFLPDKTIEQLEYFRKHPEVDFVYGLADGFLEANTPKPAWVREGSLKKGSLDMSPCTWMVKRSLLGKIGAFNEDFIYTCDVEWFVRAQRKGAKIAYLEKSVARKRVHDGNQSAHPDPLQVKKYYDEMLRIFRKQ